MKSRPRDWTPLRAPEFQPYQTLARIAGDMNGVGGRKTEEGVAKRPFSKYVQAGSKQRLCLEGDFQGWRARLGVTRGIGVGLRVEVELSLLLEVAPQATLILNKI